MLRIIYVKQIFTGKEASNSDKLYSSEHKQDFEADNAKVSIARNPKENKLHHAIDGTYYADWFREQKKKFLQSIEVNIKEPKQQKGMGKSKFK